MRYYEKCYWNRILFLFVIKYDVFPPVGRRKNQVFSFFLQKSYIQIWGTYPEILPFLTFRFGVGRYPQNHQKKYYVIWEWPLSVQNIEIFFDVGGIVRPPPIRVFYPPLALA